MSCSVTPGSEGWLWGAHLQLPAKFGSLTHYCLGSGCESLASRVRGHWVGQWGEIGARGVFPNPPPGTAECPGQLRDSPCPAFPLAAAPRLLTSSVPALHKQLTTNHQLTTTPSRPAAPLCPAARNELIPPSAPAETLGKTTHITQLPSQSSGRTRLWAEGWGRKEICLSEAEPWVMASSPSSRHGAIGGLAPSHGVLTCSAAFPWI